MDFSSIRPCSAPPRNSTVTNMSPEARVRAETPRRPQRRTRSIPEPIPRAARKPTAFRKRPGIPRARPWTRAGPGAIYLRRDRAPRKRTGRKAWDHSLAAGPGRSARGAAHTSGYRRHRPALLQHGPRTGSATLRKGEDGQEDHPLGEAQGGDPQAGRRGAAALAGGPCQLPGEFRKRPGGTPANRFSNRVRRARRPSWNDPRRPAAWAHPPRRFRLAHTGPRPAARGDGSRAQALPRHRLSGCRHFGLQRRLDAGGGLEAPATLGPATPAADTRSTTVSSAECTKYPIQGARLSVSVYPPVTESIPCSHFTLDLSWATVSRG